MENYLGKSQFTASNEITIRETKTSHFTFQEKNFDYFPTLKGGMGVLELIDFIQ